MANTKILAGLGLLLGFSQLAQAQQAPPPGMTAGRTIDYPGCKHPSFAIDGGEPPAGLVAGSPDSLFHAHLADKAVRKLHGMMLIQMQIDTLGHGCCNRIQNFTQASDEEVKALRFDQVVPQGVWQYVRPKSPALQPVAASIMLKLSFDGRNGYTVNYARMTGFKLAKPKN